jgi:hypothetical protein
MPSKKDMNGKLSKRKSSIEKFALILPKPALA